MSGRGVTLAPLHFAVTDARTSLAHLVTYEVMATGRSHGRYTHEVLERYRCYRRAT
jgi:hypothetical protein